MNEARIFCTHLFSGFVEQTHPAMARTRNKSQARTQKKKKNMSDQKDRRQAQARVLGGLVKQTVVANLPADARPIPAWRQKQIDDEAKRKAAAATTTAPPQPTEGDADATAEAGGGTAGAAAATQGAASPATTSLSQPQEQYRSPFPADYYTFRELESLLNGYAKDQKKKFALERAARKAQEPLEVAAPRSAAVLPSTADADGGVLSGIGGAGVEDDRRWKGKIQVLPLVRVGAHFLQKEEGPQQQQQQRN